MKPMSPTPTRDEKNKAGRAASPNRLSSTTEPQERLGPAGFDPARVEDLAKQCEKAEGPDRELDFRIWAALHGVTEITDPAEGHPMTPGRGGRVEGRGPDGELHLYGFVDPGKVQRNWTPYGGEDRYPPYTRSLDTASALAIDGYYRLNVTKDGAEALALTGSWVRAKTAALALTAAFLREAAAKVRESNQ